MKSVLCTRERNHPAQSNGRHRSEKPINKREHLHVPKPSRIRPLSVNIEHYTYEVGVIFPPCPPAIAFGVPWRLPFCVVLNGRNG